MREVWIEAVVRSAADEGYRLLSDFDAYPRYMSSVRSVNVREPTDGGCTSVWEVEFREGTLKWIERDTFTPEQNRIDFEQIEGDLLIFKGSWQVTEAEDGKSRVDFRSVFDLGIPSLAAFLEPVAEDALVENVEKVLRGLFGSDTRIDVTRREEIGAEA
jgi:ribosome-associated toxin RatA of RatAB toxin-antitoxin module